MLTILSVGEDSHLLRTRAEVLRRTGADVLSSTGAAADRFILQWEFDVIVLCHSMQERDVKRIAQAAQARSAKTRILLISPDGFSTVEIANIVRVAATFDPGGLLRSVSELLNPENGDGHKQPAATVARLDPSKKPGKLSGGYYDAENMIAPFEKHRAS